MAGATASNLATPLTVSEFLAWDGGGHVGKLELVDGVVRAMAPASAAHAVIQANIVTAINNHLRKSNSPCRAGTEAPIVPPMAKRINARAPDVSVTCSPPSTEGTFENPILIVEVVSPSNEADTWETIRALAGLTSLHEILVVASTRIEVQVFRRDGQGAWPADAETREDTDIVTLTSIGLEMPLVDVYRDTLLARDRLDRS